MTERDYRSEQGDAERSSYETVRPSGFKDDEQLRRDRSSQAQSKQNADSIYQLRNVLYKSVLEGLQLRWVNANSVTIAPGSFGRDGQIYTIPSTLDIMLDTAVPAAAQGRWVYVFIAFDSQDATRFKPYLGVEVDGRNIPATYNQRKRIGTLLLTATRDGFVRFFQSGAGAYRHYSVVPHYQILPHGVLPVAMTQFADYLPLGLTDCEMYFDYQAAAGVATRTVSIRVVPDGNSLTAAEIQSPADTAQVGITFSNASTSLAIHGAFSFAPSGADIWAQYTTDGTAGNASLSLSGYTDDLGLSGEAS